MRLDGKTAIVTGAGSGFGAGIARRFAAEGAAVRVADVNAAAAEAVAAEAGATPVPMDVTRAEDWAALAASALADWGRIDILVNNAGVTHLPAPVDEVSEDDFERVLAVNCRAIWLSARTIVPAMRAAGRGAIVNVASTAALSPRPRLTWYNASKGWVVTATKSMAVELAPRGVRVNALCPVAGETPLLASFMGGDTPDARARFLATIPLGRFSTPDDLAAAALYLASDEASMITGVALEVDGGRCV